MYSEFALPFWFNTRPENCTEEVMKRINEAGAYRISFGLECGNEEYRRKVLLRQVSNKKIIERFDIIANSGIAFSVNLIIGFPGETRELIMDTVELVRSLSGFDTLTVSIFTPYHGTRLRDVAVRNGWLDPKTITVHTTSNSLLDMPPPYLSSVDIDGLMRVVPLYCYFPKSEWKTLRRAETDDDEGNKILAEYMTIYQDEFLGMTQDDKKNILIEGGTGCRSNPKDSFFVSAPRLTESQLISLTP
jgi:anaerobic magnesium-protoporphyrin IX monomethyl ester cyclase